MMCRGINVWVIVSLFGILSFSSCKKEEAPQGTPQQEIVLIEQDKSFIESLSLFYYGQDLPLLERSRVVAGEQGSVTYSMIQIPEHEGTDSITVYFEVNSVLPVFDLLSFEILVDMRTRGVNVIKVNKDGEDMSTVNLILLLGDWD